MFGKHHPVVHLVDMVAGEHQHEARRLHAKNIAVLVDGVRRAGIPAIAKPLLGGQDVHKLPHRGIEKAPTALQMLDQAMSLVLGGDAHAPNAGIDAIAQCKVDNSVLAAERKRRLGAPGGEPLEPGATAARENHSVAGTQ